MKKLKWACLPVEAFYKAVAEVITNFDYTEMTEKQFIGECMKSSHGACDPNKFSVVYKELIENSGVKK